jgi:hypothetical protein
VKALFDDLARAGNRPMLVRSLYLWHQILGPACEAEAVLRRMAGRIVTLPVGADIAEQSISIRPIPEGFDIQENVLPGADAVFAYVSDLGLRLVMSSHTLADGRVCRRLRVVNAEGAPFHRHGPERFMLRYRLDPAIARARDVLVLQLSAETTRQATVLPVLHPWIEIHRESARKFVDIAETSAGMLADGEAISIAAFAPGALAKAISEIGEAAGLYFYLELTGEIIDASLLGETLVT